MRGKLHQGGKELNFSPVPPTFSIAPQTFSIAPPKTFSIAPPKTFSIAPQSFINTSSRTTPLRLNISTTQHLWAGQVSKTISVNVPNQGQFRAGALTRFFQEWSDITDDPVTLQAIKGVKLPMTSKPPVIRPTKTELSVRRDEAAIDAAIKVAPIQVLVLVSLENFITP